MSTIAILSAVLLVIVAMPRHHGRARGSLATPPREALFVAGTANDSAIRTESVARRWERTLGAKVGGLVLGLMRRNVEPANHGGGDTPLWIGRATAYALVLFPISRPASLIVGTILLTLPVLRRRRRTRQAEAALLDSLPDVIDLLAIAVAAGCNLRLAIEAVASIIPGAARAPLTEVCGRVSRGQRLGDALVVLHGLPGYQGLAAALIDAERYGTPLARALDGLAHEARALRRRRAEEAARRLPITLLFPLVLCVLPAFALLTVVPLLAGSLLSLRL